MIKKYFFSRIVLFLSLFFIFKIISIFLHFIFLPKEEVKKDTLIISYDEVLSFPFLISKRLDISNFWRLGMNTYWYQFNFLSTNIFLTIADENKNGNESSSIILYDISKRKIIWTLSVGKKFSSDNTMVINVSPDRKYILWVVRKKGDSHELNILKINRKESLNLKLLNSVSNLDGRPIKVFKSFFSVVAWDTQRNIVFLPLVVNNQSKIVEINFSTLKYRIITNGEGVAISPDNRYIGIIINREEDKIKIIDLFNSKEMILEVIPLSEIRSISWSNSGKGLYCMGQIKESLFWGVYYISLNNFKCYLIKRKLWLYWGGRGATVLPENFISFF